MFRSCAIKREIVATNLSCCCCCAAILGYCSVRDWTGIYYVIGFENIRIHPCTLYRIRCGFFFFPLRRADLKISGFAVEFAGCAWTVAVSGKKKLRIQKYPGTCGRGLNQTLKCHGIWIHEKWILLVVIFQFYFPMSAVYLILCVLEWRYGR